MTKKKININIDGRNFTVVGDGSEEYVRKLASHVDKKITDITSKNDKLSSSMAATLAAFNITDEFYKSNEELETLKNEAKDPMKNYDNILEQLDEQKRNNEELTGKYKAYKEEVMDTRQQNQLLNEEIENNKRALAIKEKELQENQKLIKKLQNKIFENQMELIETKKELEEVLKSYNDEKNIFSKEEI